jgi:hypothetical protein
MTRPEAVSGSAFLRTKLTRQRDSDGRLKFTNGRYRLQALSLTLFINVTYRIVGISGNCSPVGWRFVGCIAGHLILKDTGTTKDNLLSGSPLGGGGIGWARASIASVS